MSDPPAQSTSGEEWVLPSLFALRHPLLSFEVLTRWTEGLPTELGARRAGLRARLADLVAGPLVREALLLASPGLLDSVETWRAAPESDAGRKVERALTRYLFRMAGRSTPFGLFAALALGRVGRRTHLPVGAPAQLRRVTRLTGAATEAIAISVAAAPDGRRALHYFPNATLYRAGDEWRFYALEPSVPDPRYGFVALEATPAFDALLERAKKGATLSACAKAVRAASPGASAAEAAAFVDEVVAAQALCSELEPALTCDDPFGEQLERLRARGLERPDLSRARATLEAIDAGGLGQGAGAYAGLREAVPGATAGAPVYVDLYDPAEPELASSLVREALDVAALLVRLGGERLPLLDGLRARFVARHGRAEIRLVDLFDPSSGLGFDDSTGLEVSDHLGVVSEAGAPEAPVPGPLERLLGRRLGSALRERHEGIALDRRTLVAALPKEAPLRATSRAIMLVVHARSAEAAAAGDAMVELRYVAQMSFAGMFGRQAHGSPELAQHLRKLGAEEAERRPGVVPLELVHRASVHKSHLLTRPSLGRIDLVLLGRSGLPPDRQLTVDDLWVSVQGDRFVLRSERLGAEVLPLLANAHNYALPNQFALYRFLGLLAVQGTPAWTPQWGAAGASVTHLPRVTVGRVVIAPATWIFGAEDLAGLTGEPDVDHAHWQALRSRHGIPRFVRTKELENELLIDLDNPFSVEGLAHAAKGSRAAELVEAFSGPGWSTAANGAEGGYLHEVIVPALSANPERPEATALGFAPGRGPRHHPHPPGSAWLYGRLYATAASCDRFLQGELAALLARAKRARHLAGWSFARGGGAQPHLRLWLRSPGKTLAPALLAAVSRACERGISRGHLERLELDTWDPELERFGGPEGQALAQAWFEADSAAVVKALRSLPVDAVPQVRWRVALAGAAGLLRSGGLGLAASAELSAALALEARRAARARPEVEGRLSARYRAERATLEALVRGTGEGAGLARSLAPLANRDRALAATAGRLERLIAKGRLSVSRDAWLGEQLREHVGRVGDGSAAHALLVFELLARVLRSEAARQAKG